MGWERKVSIALGGGQVGGEEGTEESRCRAAAKMRTKGVDAQERLLGEGIGTSKLE